MKNEWDAPTCSPMRLGDRDRAILAEAIGSAQSEWEGIEAELGGLFSDITGDTKPSLVYSRTRNVPGRAALVRRAMTRLAADLLPTDARALTLDVEQALDAYDGWSKRRNEIAHGYITSCESPDYSDPEQPIVETFSLCPTHGAAHEWQDGQPEYSYNASDVQNFVVGFRALSARLAHIAERIAEFRDQKNIPPYNLTP